MYFEQFYLPCLSHASYMIGSGGVAAVVDPRRDVDIYLDEARRRELRIGYVIETHLHEDFVSGHRELAEVTGAAIYLGARAGAAFRHVPVRDGDLISFGNCRLEFLETPGHTVESVSVLVTDLECSGEPRAVLTGDTLFLGGAGRPDFFADRASRELAALLFRSSRKLMRLPDDVEIWPAHGAGFACDRDSGAELRSTLGKERRANSICRISDPDEFVALLTAGLREPPGYFAADAEINRRGAAALWRLPPLEPLEPLEVVLLQRGGATVLDTRPERAFEAAYIPGSLHIGLDGRYASWAGTLLGVGAEVVLFPESLAGLAESRLRLARVGIERIAGYVRGLDCWVARGLPFARVARIGAAELATRLRAVQVVDVRRPAEFLEGHIKGALPHPLDRLRESSRHLDPARPVAVYCRDGYRSAIAASLLRLRGFADVADVAGGFLAWEALRLPMVRPLPAGS